MHYERLPPRGRSEPEKSLNLLVDNQFRVTYSHMPAINWRVDVFDKMRSCQKSSEDATRLKSAPSTYEGVVANGLGALAP